MTFNKNVVLAFAVGIGAGVAAGCQTYDFEPVEPLAIAQTTQAKKVIAKQAKPNLMLLVDKSGSMLEPIDPSQTCGAAPKSPCPPNVPTRLSDMKAAMNTFLTQYGATARMGMAKFPSDNSCGPTNAIDVELSQSNDVDAELRAKASEINTAIQSIAANGGTPTGLSLRFLGNYDKLNDPSREDFILLLTDGLPNCNPQNPNNCGNATACRCTLSGGNCGSPGAPFCTLGCLDQQGAVAEIAALRPKGIRTVVVGFGAELATGEARATLDLMAEAGGFARACPGGQNSECGTDDTCDTASKLCRRRFYSAKNAAELAKALEDIGRLIGQGDPCVYTLEAQPSDPKFLSVLIDGTAVMSGPDTWRYEAGKVTFLGQLCTRLQNATSTSPVNVEFRIVEGL